jgi:transposase
VSSERYRDATRLMRWHFAHLGLDRTAERLVFFDESGVNLSMTRAYGWAPSSQRVHDHVPKNWGESTTLVAGIALRGLVAPLMLRGSMTGDIFADYIEKDVAPRLHPGDIVLLDNLGAHRVQGVQSAIEHARASLLYLPPYSPDLNPIELAWSKVKALIRAARPRCFDALVDALAAALAAITSTDILGWFHHAGY